MIAPRHHPGIRGGHAGVNGLLTNQAALDFSSSRMIRRSVSSNLGRFSGVKCQTPSGLQGNAPVQPMLSRGFCMDGFSVTGGILWIAGRSTDWGEHNPVSPFLELLHIDLGNFSQVGPFLEFAFSGAVLHDGLGVMLGKTQASGDNERRQGKPGRCSGRPIGGPPGGFRRCAESAV